ncbi:MAG: 3-hydroxyisobutyrate dehydrogenase [Chloroflexi bacterium]|jgi:3-hydroxyisobutyrate dehydrogenase|nr:MAG: 3-hydroxyisobutyrate dehydrogenase [Chloroflexota bacterium]
MSKKVGFIGLGTMGGPMATNLIKAGHDLTIYDINGEAVEAIASLGAKVAGSAREATEGVEVVICMLPASQHVVAAANGPDGFIAGLRSGTTVIDMSTIDPDTTRKVAEAVTAAGARMLDGPVSGGSAGAISATLTIMVGGDADLLEAQYDLLSAMGTNIIHCGSIGMGETVKLANNLVAAVAMVGVAEAFALGVAKGADPQVMFDVMSKSSGNCWPLETRCPVPGVVADSPASHGFAPGFMTDLMYKDLGLALAAGSEVKLPMTMAAVAREMYAAASRQGYGRLDFSAVAKLLEPGA